MDILYFGLKSNATYFVARIVQALAIGALSVGVCVLLTYPLLGFLFCLEYLCFLELKDAAVSSGIFSAPVLHLTICPETWFHFFEAWH